MGLSAPGIGSSLDVNGIIAQLMAVESQPLSAIDKQIASYKSKLSAVGSLKSAISTFQNAAKEVGDLAKLQPVTSKVAADDVASASATGSAAAGTYSLVVTQLAQAQKLAAAGQLSSSAPIGAGVITFDFGTIDAPDGSFDVDTGKYTGAAFTSNGTGMKSVTIDPSNTSLTGIRDAINKANVGVSATIVNDGGDSPYRLVLTSATTGKDQSMKISVNGEPALAALLDHNPGEPAASQALSQTAAAQNAVLTIDGLTVSKSKNVLTDVIEGVTLTLKKTNADAPTSLTVARDSSAVTGTIGRFVFAYNQITQTLKDLTAYNPATKQAGAFNGDATVRSIQTELKGVLTSPVEGGGSGYSLLNQAGITLQKDGTLAVDNTKLEAAMNANFAGIGGLFARVGTASDGLVKYTGATDKTKPGTYAIHVDQVATRAVTVGKAPVPQTIGADNDTLEVKLDGLTMTIKLTQGDYTPAQLAIEVQSRINSATEFSAAGSSVSVSQTGGFLTIMSNRYGSGSNVQLTANTAGVALLGASPAVTAGTDVIGTIGGVAATGSGRTLKGASGSPAEGIALEIDATGDRGTINYSLGYGARFERMLTDLLGTTGALAARSEGINSSIKALESNRVKVNDRLMIVEKRYRAQFTALDTAIASMNTTSAFLSQQLASLSSLSQS